MDPATIGLVLKACNLVKGAKLSRQISDIQSKLDIIIAKSDQLIIREIMAAYKAIDDALSTDSDKTRQIRLSFAEEHLLKNISLNLALTRLTHIFFQSLYSNTGIARFFSMTVKFPYLYIP